MIRPLFNTTLFFLALLTFDGHGRSGGVGNGGDGIVCGDEVVLLDSYEAQKLRLDIDLGDETDSIRSMVKIAITRLKKHDQFTANLLEDYAMEMVNDLELFEVDPAARGKHTYLGEDIIAEINDSHHVSTPAGCEEHTRQLVSQRIPRFRLDYRYEISKILWEKMSRLDQAMTVLHEAWYRIMLENGARNSIATRYINGLVASKQFEQYTFAEYIEEIKETELKSYFIKNTSQVIKDSVIEIDLKNNNFSQGTDGSSCGDNISFNPSIKETYTLVNRAQSYLKNLKFQAVCFKNSKIHSVILPREVFQQKTTLRLYFYQLDISRSLSETPTIYFHSSGKLKSFKDISFSNMVEMFYVCNGQKSFTEYKGCEKGPFINHATEIKDPTNILFDQNEKPNYFN